MRRLTTRPIRLVAVLAAGGALALTGCGDDDSSGGGSTDAFCEEITSVAESDDTGDDAANLAALRAVADVAPGEIADDMNQLVDAFERLQSFDPEAASEEELAEFFEIAEGVDEASTRIEEFAIENCPDLPADLFSTE